MRVTLNEVGCCALTHAFLRNPRMVSQWSHRIGRFELFYEIFQNTSGIAFMPNRQTIVIYRTFARAERRRLKEALSGDARLRCRHSALAHLIALQSLLDQFPKGH